MKLKGYYVVLRHEERMNTLNFEIAGPPHGPLSFEAVHTALFSRPA